MPKGKHISLSDKGAIVALRQEGKSLRIIGKQLGLHFMSVGKFLKIYKEGGGFDVAARSGRRMQAVLDANGGHTKYWSNFAIIITIFVQ